MVNAPETVKYYMHMEPSGSPNRILNTSDVDSWGDVANIMPPMGNSSFGINWTTPQFDRETDVSSC